MRRALTAAAAAGLLATGCGSARPAATTAQASAPATAATSTATATAAATATPSPAATPKAGRRPRAKAAAMRTPDPTPAATSAPSAPNVVLACLRRAGLAGAQKQRPRVWAGETPGKGAQVLVEGPYRTPAKAQASAATLTEVSLVEPAGRYVVTAALTSGAGAAVHEVARCLSG